MKNKLIIAITAAIAAVIALVIYSNSTKSLVLSGSSGYDIVLTSEAHDIKQRIDQIRLTMYAKNVEKLNNNNIIYFLITDVSTSKLKNIIIPVEMADNGNIVHIEYPAAVENDDMLYSLFQYFFQTINPVMHKDAKQWEDVLYTDNGYIKSQYTQKGSNIEKTKNLVEDYNIDINIVSSDIKLSLSSSFWLKNASSNEDFIVKGSGGISNAQINNTVKLEQIPYDKQYDSYFTKNYSTLLAEYKKEKQYIFDTKRNYLANYKKLDSTALALVMKEFEDKFSKMNDNSNDSYFAMKKLLEKNPQLLASIPKKLKQIGEEDNVAARMLIGMLSHIGTADAQSILTVIMKDDEIAFKNRLRAVVALNTVQNPSDHTIDSLIQTSQLRDSDDNNVIADSSILALGSAGSKLLGKTEKYDDVRNYFDNALVSSDENTSSTLLGIGNTADEYFYDKVTPYLTSQNESNREAAVYAAASTNFNEFMNGADSFLQNETSASVRSKVYDAFTASTQPTAEMTNIVKNNFKNEASVVQNSMLSYLKKNAKQVESEQYLQELMNSNMISSQEKIDIRHVLGSK